MKPKKPTPPKKEKPKEELISFGLSLDLEECFDEFAELAKVLPFPKGPAKG